MKTFKKFENREDYQNWIIQLWENLEKWNTSLWEPEDDVALKPFWDWSASSARFNNEPMPDGIKPLVTLYLEKSKEYADERKELVGSFTKLTGNMEGFFYFFLFDYEEDGNSDSDFYDLNDFSVNEVVPDEPFICFIWVDSDFDRLGDMEIQVLDFITERELNEAVSLGDDADETPEEIVDGVFQDNNGVTYWSLDEKTWTTSWEDLKAWESAGVGNPFTVYRKENGKIEKIKYRISND